MAERLEHGRFVPLPRELFDHSLSDAELQDRWVAGAERKVQELRAERRYWLTQRGAMLPDEFADVLVDLDTRIDKAEEFLAEAKWKQRHYHETKTQPTPRPARVQALLTRRTPAQVQALLDGVAEQSTEIASKQYPLLPKGE